MKAEHLKRWRVVVSLSIFVLTSLVFLDFTSFFPASWTNGVVFVQFLPSLLKFLGAAGLGATGFAIILLLTLVFGRVYCSSICPLGTLQDIISFLARKIEKKKCHRQTKANGALHYSILIAVVVCALLGSFLPLNLLDPFSSFGRIVVNIVKPVGVNANNAIAFTLQRFGLYSLHPYEIKSVVVSSVMVPMFIVVILLWMAYRHGRLYCNAICPVGALLRFMSKFSFYRIGIDVGGCIGCNLCESVCKSGCIDKRAKSLDFARCIGCYNCLSVCPTGGLVLERRIPQMPPPTKFVSGGALNPVADLQRREIVVKALLFLVGLPNVALRRKIGTKESTVKVVRTLSVLPPGAIGLERFANKCTACHLCVSTCPSQVITPSFLEYGIDGIMRPHMNYRASFCNFECTACTEICPSGALLPLTKESKKTTQLGAVKFVKDNCIVKTEETECGACSEHCPTKAVNMVPYKNKLVIPEVKEEYCIGCGACEYACPTKPYKAIYVDGKAVHGMAKKPKVKKLDEQVQEEFPF